MIDERPVSALRVVAAFTFTGLVAIGPVVTLLLIGRRSESSAVESVANEGVSALVVGAVAGLIVVAMVLATVSDRRRRAQIGRT